MSQLAAQPAPSLMPQELLYEVDDAIATVTLNAPQRMNTISGPMLKQLTEGLVKANEDREVRVVIMTGTGRAFCGRTLNAEQSVPLMQSDDMREGIEAFLEKRTPTFTGR